MVRRRSYIFQVIVFAADSHTLLGIRRPGILPLFQAKKDVLELIHPGVGEQQSWVITRHQRVAGNDGVIFTGEKIEKSLSDLRAGH